MSFNPKIDLYGRWCFMVDSETRPGMVHLVDLEPELNIEGNIAHGGEPWKCSCEAHQFNVTRPCKHVHKVIEFLGPIMKYIAAFPGARPVSVETKSATSFKTRSRNYQLDPHKKYDPTAANKKPS